MLCEPLEQLLLRRVHTPAPAPALDPTPATAPALAPAPAFFAKHKKEQE